MPTSHDHNSIFYWYAKQLLRCQIITNRRSCYNMKRVETTIKRVETNRKEKETSSSSSNGRRNSYSCGAIFQIHLVKFIYKKMLIRTRYSVHQKDLEFQL